MDGSPHLTIGYLLRKSPKCMCRRGANHARLCDVQVSTHDNCLLESGRRKLARVVTFGAQKGYEGHDLWWDGRLLGRI
jgi:hypothetical protein